uniref:Transposase n=1 Tax=Heterorhabditis bacteriophora TaxID=37862 RepID=A0A1I7XI43_HETBA
MFRVKYLVHVRTDPLPDTIYQTRWSFTPSGLVSHSDDAIMIEADIRNISNRQKTGASDGLKNKKIFSNAK